MKPFKQEYEYFLLLCKNLNISKAAEEAGIQQAGLSKSLKTLEDQIKKPLFYRTNRGLKLTAYGEIFRDVLIKSSIIWDSSLETELSKLAQISGTYRIGVHPSIAINVLFKFFPELIEEYDGLKLKLELKKSQEVTQEVIDHKCDFGIVANPIRHPDLVIVKLHKEFIACWSSHKKIEKKVLYYNPEMIEIVHTIKKYQNYKLVEINNYELIASLHSNFCGICLLPSPIAQRYNLLQIGKHLLDVDICLIYRQDSLKTKAFSEIINRIKKSILV